MKKKICTIFLMILIVVGIVMGLLNFSTNAYAKKPDVIYGTTTYINSILLESWLKWAGRWLYDHYFCMEDSRNCCIVFTN